MGAGVYQPLGGRPGGTGGTPYRVWLRQLIEETRLRELPP